MVVVICGRLVGGFCVSLVLFCLWGVVFVGVFMAMSCLVGEVLGVGRGVSVLLGLGSVVGLMVCQCVSRTLQKIISV